MKRAEFDRTFCEFMAGFPGFTPVDMESTMRAYYRVCQDESKPAVDRAILILSQNSGNFFPSLADFSRAVTTASAQVNAPSQIVLRPLNSCYKDLQVGRLECGCRDCDPVGFEEWERRYTSKRDYRRAS